MEKITANHPLSKSADIIQQNLETLKSLFPTIVKEGKIDVTELQALLGDEIETGDEYYRFTWAGKSQARQEANKPSTGTLRPVPSKSAKRNGEKYQPGETFSSPPSEGLGEASDNLFIEGDNLEVLKLMQKSYANKIKMIYIDPPYNTGKDFVYKDNYNDNLGNYLSITGQTDEAGKKLSTNTESDGRYHSNWLNMMYPRLKLARNLLKEDGVIFISIDDNEVANLRKVCDEIFGEENTVGIFCWRKKAGGGADSKLFFRQHEYILLVAKNIKMIDSLYQPLNKKQIAEYKNPDNDTRGNWAPTDLKRADDNDPKRIYEVISPTGIPFTACWAYTKDNFKKLIEDDLIWWGKEFDKEPRRKRFLKDKVGLTPRSWIDTILTSDGTKDLRKIDFENIFDFPKPLELLKLFLSIGLNNNDIILDFFAGSGTTAHATMQLNAEDASAGSAQVGNRKFICVQLPEPTPPKSEAFKAGYKTIAEITKERIRRAGAKIREGMMNEAKKSSSITHNSSSKKNSSSITLNSSLDTGFRVFKLDSSNIKAWDGDVKNFQQNLLSASENIKEDRTEEDVLYEVLLKSGLDLAQPIEEKTIAGRKVFNIGAGALFICLAGNITKAVAEGIGQWKQELEPATCRVIFKDTGFTDVEKTNSVQILKRYGINEVNTI